MYKLLTAILLMLIFIGCEKSDSPENGDDRVLTFDSTDIKGVPIDASENTLVNLIYNLPDNKSVIYRLTNISEDNQVIKFDTVMSQFVKQNITYIVEMTKKESDESAVEFNFTFKSINLNVETNNEKFKYRSGAFADSADKAKFSEYEGMIDNPITVRMDAQGNILDITKLDKVTSKILEYRGIKDSVSAEEKQYYQKQIVEEAYRSIIGMFFRKIPNKQVGIDSTWAYPQPPLNMQIFQFENTHKFTLTSFEKVNDDKIAVIDASLSSRTILSPEAKANNIDVKKAQFIAGGKIFFNVTKGLVQKSKTNTNMNIELEAMVPTPKGVQKVTRTQKVTNTSIIELL